MLIISVSDNILVESEFFFFKTMRYFPSQHKVFVYTLDILCYETQSDKLPNSVFQLRVRNSCVEGREVKCLNVIAGGKGPRLYVL